MMTKLINGSMDPYVRWYEENGKFFFEDDNERVELIELPDDIYWDNDKGYLLKFGQSLDTIVR